MFGECFKGGECKYCNYRPHLGIPENYDHDDMWDSTFRPMRPAEAKREKPFKEQTDLL